MSTAVRTPDRPAVPALNQGIRRAVLAAGLSNAEAAYRLSVGPSTLSNWCLGRSTPTDSHVKRFCARFGVDESDLRAGLPDLYAATD